NMMSGNDSRFSPECSVIMPCYNARRFIGRSIESVINQTFQNWELVIIDDGSVDDTPEYIKEHYADGDRRIRLLKLERNSGAAVARNTGIKHAAGRFIAFLDSDDTWDPDKLRLQLAFMKEQQHPFTFTGYRRICGGRELNEVGTPEKVNYEQLLKTNIIGCLTVIYDTQALGKVYMPLIRKR